MPKLGDRVKVRANHWSRGNQFGLIVDPEAHELSEVGERFLIFFDKEGVGIEARLLFLDEKDFLTVNDR